MHRSFSWAIFFPFEHRRNKTSITTQRQYHRRCVVLKNEYEAFVDLNWIQTITIKHLINLFDKVYLWFFRNPQNVTNKFFMVWPSRCSVPVLRCTRLLKGASAVFGIHKEVLWCRCRFLVYMKKKSVPVCNRCRYTSKKKYNVNDEINSSIISD
jgi:hypothetical protein